MTDKATNIVSTTDSATQMTHVANKTTETGEDLLIGGNPIRHKKKMLISEVQEEFNDDEHLEEDIQVNMKNINKIIETKSSRIKQEVKKESERVTQNHLKEIMSKHLAFEYKMKLIENTLKAKVDDLMSGMESM